MRVFVTGATGFIGSAVVRELISAGHSVLGLARNDAAAEALRRANVDVHRGDLTNIDSLVAGAKACDGMIHTAFIHDFSQYAASVDTDRRAIAALIDALEGTNKSFVISSGTALLASDRVATELDIPPDGSGPHLRAVAERAVLEAGKRGIRSSVIRLPPSVHGAGDHGFVPAMIDVARRTGFAGYVGEGANRWPAVHRFDAARVYRLALEKGTPGTPFHAVAEEGIPMRAIAAAIGEGLAVPVRSLSKDEAAKQFAWLAGFLALDNPTTSAITRKTFDWNPQEPDLLRDMRENGYFTTKA